MRDYRVNPDPHAQLTLSRDDINLLSDAVGVARQCEDMYRGYSRTELDGMFNFLRTILEELK